MSVKSIVVTASNHNYCQTPVEVQLDARPEFRSIKLTDAVSGALIPAQWERSGGGVELTWIEPGLEAGASKTYHVNISQVRAADSAEECVQLETDSEGRLDVLVRGEFVTSYYSGPQWQRPYFHPVMGPYGDPVTRGFPMVRDAPGETTDHPHHRGIYVAYGDVNGVDNWTEGSGRGHTVHRVSSPRWKAGRSTASPKPSATG